MNKMRMAALMAAAAGLSSGAEIPMPRWGAQPTYPHSSATQRGRFERQMAAGKLDFSATEKCLARIRERLQKGRTE